MDSSLDAEVYEALKALTEESDAPFQPSFTLVTIAARVYAKRYLKQGKDSVLTRFWVMISRKFSEDSVNDALERLNKKGMIESFLRADKWRYRLPVPRLMSK